MTSWPRSRLHDHLVIRLRPTHRRCTRRNFPGPLPPSLRVQGPMLPYSLRRQAPARAHTTTRACTHFHTRCPRALVIILVRRPRSSAGYTSRPSRSLSGFSGVPCIFWCTGGIEPPHRRTGAPTCAHPHSTPRHSSIQHQSLGSHSSLSRRPITSRVPRLKSMSHHPSYTSILSASLFPAGMRGRCPWAPSQHTFTLSVVPAYSFSLGHADPYLQGRRDLPCARILSDT